MKSDEFPCIMGKKKHVCCCGIIHSKTATLALCILEAFGLILTIVPSVLNFERESNESLIKVVWLLVHSVLLGLLFMGLIKEKADLLMPFFVYTVLGVIVGIFMALLLVISAIFASYLPADSSFFVLKPDKQTDFYRTRLGLLVYAMVVSVTVLFKLWCADVIRKCCMYLREIEACKRASEMGITNNNYI